MDENGPFIVDHQLLTYGKKRDFPLRKQFTGGSLHDPIFISPKSRNPVASRPGLPTLLMY